MLDPPRRARKPRAISNRGMSEVLAVSDGLRRERPIWSLKYFNAESMSLKHSSEGYSFTAAYRVLLSVFQKSTQNFMYAFYYCPKCQIHISSSIWEMFSGIVCLI